MGNEFAAKGCFYPFRVLLDGHSKGMHLSTCNQSPRDTVYISSWRQPRWRSCCLIGNCGTSLCLLLRNIEPGLNFRVRRSSEDCWRLCLCAHSYLHCKVPRKWRLKAAVNAACIRGCCNFMDSALSGSACMRCARCPAHSAFCRMNSRCFSG